MFLVMILTSHLHSVAVATLSRWGRKHAIRMTEGNQLFAMIRICDRRKVGQETHSSPDIQYTFMVKITLLYTILWLVH